MSRFNSDSLALPFGRKLVGYVLLTTLNSSGQAGNVKGIKSQEKLGNGGKLE